MSKDYLVTTIHLVSGTKLTCVDPIEPENLAKLGLDVKDVCDYMADELQKAGVKVERIGPHFLNWDNVAAITFEVDPG